MNTRVSPVYEVRVGHLEGVGWVSYIDCNAYQDPLKNSCVQVYLSSFLSLIRFLIYFSIYMELTETIAARIMI